MKTQVQFRSSKFPPYPGEEEEMNPGVWGRRLSEYLVRELSRNGVDAGEPIAEDWGWYIPVKCDGIKLAVGCGHQDGNEDEFLCFTDPKKPVIRKLFKKVDISPQLESLLKVLRHILESDSDIVEVAWSEPDT